jgi:hypothetical protein
MASSMSLSSPEVGGQPHIYTTRLQKGGALLAEMRQLVCQWDGSADCLERLIETNALSSPSRRRARDVLIRTFMPRFVNSRPADLWRSVAILERAQWPREWLLPVHYYAAASAEPLLWDFVVEVLAERQARGHAEIRSDDAVRFVRQAPASLFPGGRWSSTVTLKVARGLLAALRDFGLLAGARKKFVRPLSLPVPSFAFLAMLRHQIGFRGRSGLQDRCWRLFYQDETAVERFFIAAQQERLLSYHAAGTVVRVDFPAANLEDYAHELAERTH